MTGTRIEGPLVAGVDCSTQSTTVLIVDTATGTVVADGRAGHEVTGTGGARETDPEVWWRALGAALDATGLAGQVAAIAVGGQQHGLVMLDEAGLPLRRAMLWNDVRAAPDALLLRDALGGPEAWAERIGLVPVASFTVAKWAWLRREEPDVAAAARAVRLPHDFLTERLTGVGTTDRGDASGTGWWSTRTGDYDGDVLSLPTVDLDPGLLPRVAAPREVVGEVQSAAAAALGLQPGTVVGPGTGDNMAAALGLGLRAGAPVVSLGTSGTAYTVSQTRTVDATGTVAGFADATGRFLPLAATLNCTLAIDRFAELLGLDREDASDSAGCVVLPYLDGERTPDLPTAAGSIVGLRHDTTPREILRAAYEGAALSLLEALDAIDRCSSGLDPDAPVTLIGGGARGATWRRVVAGLSGRAVAVPASGELVALGAAVQATAVLRDESFEAVTDRWGVATAHHEQHDPVDPTRLETLRAARAALDTLNRSELF